MRFKNTDIIDRLTELRRERGFTQEYVAKKAKIFSSNICRIEQKTHSPTLGTLQKYAKGIGVDLIISIVNDNKKA